MLVTRNTCAIPPLSGDATWFAFWVLYPLYMRQCPSMACFICPKQGRATLHPWSPHQWTYCRSFKRNKDRDSFIVTFSTVANTATVRILSYWTSIASSENTKPWSSWCSHFQPVTNTWLWFVKIQTYRRSDDFQLTWGLLLLQMVSVDTTDREWADISSASNSL